VEEMELVDTILRILEVAVMLFIIYTLLVDVLKPNK
jgi:hypothetical protein